MEQKTFNPAGFTTTKAKPLPVILLLDISGSMGEVVGGSYVRTGKTVVSDKQTWEVVTGGITRIQLLNQALKKMLVTLAKEEGMGQEYLLSIITFGSDTRLHLAPTRASAAGWIDMGADGETPLGAALKVAKGLIESRESTPSRGYRPTVVLVSDGKPTDAWQNGLADLVNTGRSSKCDRMAMAIGPEADEEVLKGFIAGTDHELFHADIAEQIHEFFKRVTMSVVSRSKSKDPNIVPPDGDIRMDGSSVRDQEPDSSVSGDVPQDGGYW